MAVIVNSLTELCSVMMPKRSQFTNVADFQQCENIITDNWNMQMAGLSYLKYHFVNIIFSSNNQYKWI